VAKPGIGSNQRASAERRVVAVAGASSGIGRSVAILGAHAGDELILIARRQQLLEDLAEEVVERRTTDAGGGNCLRKPVVVAA